MTEWPVVRTAPSSPSLPEIRSQLQEAPFADVAILADSRPYLRNWGIDDDSHGKADIVRTRIEKRRGDRRTKFPRRLRWKLASLGQQLHVLQPLGATCVPRGNVLLPGRVIGKHRIIPHHDVTQACRDRGQSFCRQGAVRQRIRRVLARRLGVGVTVLRLANQHFIHNRSNTTGTTIPV